MLFGSKPILLTSYPLEGVMSTRSEFVSVVFLEETTSVLIRLEWLAFWEVAECETDLSVNVGDWMILSPLADANFLTDVGSLERSEAVVREVELSCSSTFAEHSANSKSLADPGYVEIRISRRVGRCFLDDVEDRGMSIQSLLSESRHFQSSLSSWSIFPGNPEKINLMCIT